MYWLSHIGEIIQALHANQVNIQLFLFCINYQTKSICKVSTTQQTFKLLKLESVCRQQILFRLKFCLSTGRKTVETTIFYFFHYVLRSLNSQNHKKCGYHSVVKSFINDSIQKSNQCLHKNMGFLTGRPAHKEPLILGSNVLIHANMVMCQIC